MPITLEEARKRVGDAVVYRAGYPLHVPEQGTITSVNDTFVFVRYGNGNMGLATRPEKLEFLTP